MKRYFTEAALINFISYLIRKHYLTIGNTVFKQGINVPMGIEQLCFGQTCFYIF